METILFQGAVYGRSPFIFQVYHDKEIFWRPLKWLKREQTATRQQNFARYSSAG